MSETTGPHYRCPVCGYPGLDEPPRTEESGASYEICPSCGFEFGVTDEDRGISYQQLPRERDRGGRGGGAAGGRPRAGTPWRRCGNSASRARYDGGSLFSRQQSTALRERLRHVYWIGGGSGAGKSTIARRLAARRGLRLYSTDEVMADQPAGARPTTART